jgi:hypothetical protein
MFLIREEVPEAGIPSGQWAGGDPAYFLLFFIGINISQTI